MATHATAEIRDLVIGSMLLNIRFLHLLKVLLARLGKRLIPQAKNVTSQTSLNSMARQNPVGRSVEKTSSFAISALDLLKLRKLTLVKRQ